MFIVLESYDQNDPRLVPEIEFLNQYADWMFEIAYIKPENVSKVDFSKLNYKEISEDIAKACTFTNADIEYKLGIVEGSIPHQHLIALSTEKHAYKPKVYYRLTDTDKQQLLEFMKIEMNLFLNYYYNLLPANEAAENAEFRKTIEAEVASLTDVQAARVLMHTKFGVTTFNKLVETIPLGPSSVRLTK